MRFRLPVQNSYSRFARNSALLNRQIPVALIVVFGLIYFTIVICNHYFYRTFCYDYGVYNFAFYDYAHFRVSECHLYIQEHVNFLQDHLSFTFFLFIPFYWLFGWLTGTYTLLLIQTTMVLVGGWYVHKLVDLKTQHKWLPVLALLQYLVIYGRWTALGADCNLAIMASTVVPVLMYYFIKKQFGIMYLAFGFILITREDMALWTLFIGLFFLITHFGERQSRVASLTIMAVSVVYFVIAFSLMIPALETENKKFDLFNYTTLGANPWEAFRFVVSRPAETFRLFFVNTSGNPSYDRIKFEFYFVYLLCGGFLLFLRPAYLLLFIPILAKKMLNDESVRWSIETYYSIEFVTILPIAVFLILSDIRQKAIRSILAGLAIAGTVIITVYKLQGHEDRSVYWNDRKLAFYRRSFYKPDFDPGRINRQLKTIPGKAPVSASGVIATHLAWRPEIYNFPRVENAEYIAVFTDRDTYPLRQEEFEYRLNEFLTDKNWEVITDDFPLLILKKSEDGGKPARSLLRKRAEYTCDAENLSPDGKSFLSASGLYFHNADLQNKDRVHQGQYSVRLTRESPYAMTAIFGNVKPGERFEVSVWRLGGNDFGKIVAGSNKGSVYYDAECQVMDRDGKGWELLVKKIIVPRRLPGDELKIYLWNDGPDTLYFDDLKIVREYR